MTEHTLRKNIIRSSSHYQLVITPQLGRYCLIISPFNLAFVQSDLWQIWGRLSQLLRFLSSVFLGVQKAGLFLVI